MLCTCVEKTDFTPIKLCHEMNLVYYENGQFLDSLKTLNKSLNTLILQVLTKRWAALAVRTSG